MNAPEALTILKIFSHCLYFSVLFGLEGIKLVMLRLILLQCRGIKGLNIGFEIGSNAGPAVY